MRSRKLLALLLCLITFPALAGYMTLLGAGVGSIAPVVSWVSTTDAFPSSSLTYTGTSLATMFDSTGKLTYAPNNLLLNTATLGTQAVTVQVGVSYLLSINGTGSVTLTGASTAGPLNGTGASNRVDLKITAATSSLTLTVAGSVTSARLSAVTYETAFRSQDDVDNTAAAYYGPRIDYDPNTLAVKGLLIEEARTWVALWNRDITNAVWTKTSVTAALDKTGIDGVKSASSLLATGANGTVLQAITLASSQRATSAYVKRLVGSGVVSMTTDGGATWTDITSQLGSGVYARATIPAQTVTNPSVGFKFATSGDKIAVDWFGNETGAFATSSLHSASAAFARSAETLSAAAYTTNPAIIQYRDISTRTRARKVINPWSGVSSETNEWIEAIRVYPAGTPAGYLNSRLTVDGGW